MSISTACNGLLCAQKEACNEELMCIREEEKHGIGLRRGNGENTWCPVCPLISTSRGGEREGRGLVVEC